MPNAHVQRHASSFAGTETGSDFADFLLGVPSNYIQSSGAPFFICATNTRGVFAQDSWRARSNLTINYGVRWDFMAPWYEKNNQIQTIVPGQQSVVYPHGADRPRVPGRRRHPATLSPARCSNFSPRLGIAYSPSSATAAEDALRRETEQHPRRASGSFYTAFQGLSAGIMYGVPPYGYNYLSPAPPLFETPFITAADGTEQRPAVSASRPAPLDASPSNPVPNLDFVAVPAGQRATRSSATTTRRRTRENYMFSVQRELAPNWC